MSALPTAAELAGLWPLWLVGVLFALIIFYADRRERRAHEEWERRKMRLEMRRRGIHRN
jgi:hypothetical protein